MFLVGLSMACAAVFRTINQLMAAVNVGAMALAGLGGALAPLSVLPGWAQAVAPASPAYWALEGFRAIILEGGGLSSTLVPAAVLIGFAAGCAAAAAARFRFTDEKVWGM